MLYARGIRHDGIPITRHGGDAVAPEWVHRDKRKAEAFRVDSKKALIGTAISSRCLRAVVRELFLPLRMNTKCTSLGFPVSSRSET